MMSDIIDAKLERLRSILGNLDYLSIWDDEESDSSAIPPQVRKCYISEFERLAAMSEEKRERIGNLIFSLFAVKFQALAIKKYGNDGPESIRAILKEITDEPDTKTFLKRLKDTMISITSDISPEQKDLAVEGITIIDKSPQALAELIIELYTPYRLLPLEKTQSIAAILADMMKETEYADGRTDT